MRVDIELGINGSRSRFAVEPDERLVSTLRDRAGLTGTKQGCKIGECGACSVIMDGKLVPSCLVLSASADGADLLTVEGVAQDGNLSDLQQAFVAEGAIQCGYCTPGMLLAGEYLLSRYQRPDTAQIKEAIAGNLCRCTGYTKIVAAIRKTAKKRSLVKSSAQGR